MGTGVRQALRLIRDYNITATPTVWRLYRIAYGEGLILRYFPFRGRIEGSYLRAPDGIAILTLQSGLPRGYLKHVLAHGLGFHLIHRGPGTYVHGVVETDLDGHIRGYVGFNGPPNKRPGTLPMPGPPANWISKLLLRLSLQALIDKTTSL